MSNWNTGEYADPILPEGKAIFTILSAKEKETSGGTPFVSIMARVDEFMGDYDVEDNTILAPIGQTAFGSIWLPKAEDSHEKAVGKSRRVRSFVEVLMASGADIETDVYDNPVDVLTGNLGAILNKQFQASIQQRVDPTGEYPTKAEINFFQVRRV